MNIPDQNNSLMGIPSPEMTTVTLQLGDGWGHSLCEGLLELKALVTPAISRPGGREVACPSPTETAGSPLVGPLKVWDVVLLLTLWPLLQSLELCRLSFEIFLLHCWQI